jgi:hypothetical protein
MVGCAPILRSHDALSSSRAGAPVQHLPDCLRVSVLGNRDLLIALSADKTARRCAQSVSLRRPSMVRSSRSKTHPRNLPRMMATAGYMAGGAREDWNGQSAWTLEAA